MKRMFPFVIISIALSLIATWIATSRTGSGLPARLATIRQRFTDRVAIATEPPAPEGATA